MSIGRSIVITGEITGDEDLLIAGRVEGRIHLNGCRLTLAPESRIKGDIEAGNVVCGGQIEGKIVATDRLDVQATAAIQGELTTPSLLIADGAQVVGKVEMPARKRPAAPLPMAV